MATKAERDARIDELVKATDAWEKKRVEELTARVASSKRILKGRTGAERINSALITKGEALLVDEIDTFLVG
jgi:hypothetical protein